MFENKVWMRSMSVRFDILEPPAFQNIACFGSFEHSVIVFVFLLKWTVGVMSKGHFNVYYALSKGSKKPENSLLESLCWCLVWGAIF